MTEARSPLFTGLTRHPATPVRVATHLERVAHENGGRARRDGNQVVIDAPDDAHEALSFSVDIVLVPVRDKTQIVVRRARLGGSEDSRAIVFGVIAVGYASIIVVMVASGDALVIAGALALIGFHGMIAAVVFWYWRLKAEEFVMRLVRHAITIPWEFPVSE